MRHKLTEQDRDDLRVALRTIDRIIGIEYPEPDPLMNENAGEANFRWGIGDGFRLALRSLVEAAMPGWKDQGAF